ncbi:MAG: thiamine-binding protein, partial [Gammaproteobacteria bacterium]
MKATADLQVIPLGSGVSARKEVQRAVELLKEYEFIIHTHGAGTNIEG